MWPSVGGWHTRADRGEQRRAATRAYTFQIRRRVEASSTPTRLDIASLVQKRRKWPAPFFEMDWPQGPAPTRDPFPSGFPKPLGWQTCLEEDVFQSGQIGYRILAKTQLLATGLLPRGELLTQGVPRLRIFQRQCPR